MKQALNQLQSKHLKGKGTYQEMLLLVDIPEWLHPVKFEDMYAEIIQKATIKTQSGAGPLGIFTSKQFQNSSVDLWSKFAEIIKNMYSVENQLLFMKPLTLTLTKTPKLDQLE